MLLIVNDVVFSSGVGAPITLRDTRFDTVSDRRTHQRVVARATVATAAIGSARALVAPGRALDVAGAGLGVAQTAAAARTTDAPAPIRSAAAPGAIRLAAPRQAALPVPVAAEVCCARTVSGAAGAVLDHAAQAVAAACAAIFGAN